MKEVQIYAQKFIDKGKDFKLELAIDDHIIMHTLPLSQVCFVIIYVVGVAIE